MWVKGSMGRVVPAGACSYVCRLGGMSGSRVHGDAAHAPLALHHGTRVDLLLFVIVSHARGTTHVRHVASAARHGRPPHPRPLRAVARTPLYAAVGDRVRGPPHGPCGTAGAPGPQTAHGHQDRIV